MKISLWLSLGLSGVVTSPTVHAQDVYAAARAPFAELVSGRQFKQGYPAGGKSRRMLVRDFLKLPKSGDPASFDDISHGEVLGRAVSMAVNARSSATSTPLERAALKVIAWEAMEAHAEGYLFAGNKDLLESLRASFPNLGGSAVDADTRPKPVDLNTEYAGTQARKLSYARHYFFEPVRQTLQFMAEDPEGIIRASDTDYASTGLYHYTEFDDPDQTGLPKESGFNDPNFTDIADGKTGQPTQTAGSLYGSALERWGMSSYSFADQLWRTAFTRNTAKNPTSTPGVFGAANNAAEEAEFNEMLGVAEKTLHDNVHGQFLATLPLAATLTETDYQRSRIDQARVSTTQSIELLAKIRAQEKPKATALVTAWKPSDIQDQVSRLRDALAEARRWYNGPTGDANLPDSVLASLQRAETAESENANRRIQLRTQYESQLLLITGIDPSGYNSLADAQSRSDYLKAVEEKFTALMAQPSSAVVNADGSQMTTSALRLRAAMFECESAYNSLNAFPQRIRVELERNNEVNSEIQLGTLKIAIMDQAIAIASIFEVTVNSQGISSGVSTKINMGQQLASQLTVPRALAESNQQVSINAANSQATVRNLLIDQLLAYDTIIRAKNQSDIAGSELRGLYEQAKRIAGDHFFYQDITNTLWYADPTLAFKAEAVEERYRDATQVARGEAYKLARIMEAAWAEKFSNPITTGGSPPQLVSLSTSGADNYFEAESVFAAPNHNEIVVFYNTLKDWDSRLRTASYRGAPDTTVRDVNSFGFVPLSYRQDILNLRDYRYNSTPGIERYELDATLRAKNIREFRAILRGLAESDPQNNPPISPGGFQRLRLEFPIRYDHARLVADTSGSVADPTTVVRRNNSTAGGYDLFWNHRLRKFGVKLVGSGIYPEQNGNVTSTYEWYGQLERIGFFKDSPAAKKGFTTFFDTPSYLDDPDKRTVGAAVPYFGGNIDIAFGVTSVVDSTSPPPNSVPMLQTDIPLFSNKVILFIPKASGLKIEQLDDIELYMKMQTGSPDAFGLPDASTL